MGSNRNFITTVSAALLFVVATALPLVAAHGADEPAMSEPVAAKDKPLPDDWSIGSYYEHPGYSGWMMAHIVLMIVAWTIVLPIGKSEFMAIQHVHLLFSNAIAGIINIDDRSQPS